MFICSFFFFLSFIIDSNKLIPKNLCNQLIYVLLWLQNCNFIIPLTSFEFRYSSLRPNLCNYAYYCGETEVIHQPFCVCVDKTLHFACRSILIQEQPENW
jgi:hypothetical protein